MGKRDAAQEKEAQEWIETVLGEKFPAGQVYEEVLRDGQMLCRLMNKIHPGSVPKINSSGGQFKMMENINLWVDRYELWRTVTLLRLEILPF